MLQAKQKRQSEAPRNSTSSQNALRRMDANLRLRASRESRQPFGWSEPSLITLAASTFNQQDSTHGWPSGKMDGFGKWSKTHLNQWNPSISNQTYLKRTQQSSTFPASGVRTPDKTGRGSLESCDAFRALGLRNVARC